MRDPHTRGGGGGVSRRTMFKTSLLAMAATTGLPAWFLERHLDEARAAEAPRSPNARPGILLVGCGGQGRGIANAAHNGWGRVLAVCDVDARHAAAARKQFEAEKEYADFRKALGHPGVDVVMVGTPDHWHTLVNIAALKAGKDVYSEKPLTLTIDEGKRLLKAFEGSGRILQTGTQQRSDGRFRLACELARNGRLGKLRQIWSIIPAGPRKGPFRTAPVPPGFDWEYWQGQAPATDYVPERAHTNFRYWWEYSGGTITDWGAHHNDIALWGTGQDGPLSAEGKVLVEPIPGGYTTPSQYRVDFEFANDLKVTVVSTTSNNGFGGDANPADAPLPDLPQNRLKHGVKFEGSDGWIFVTRGRIEASRPEILRDPLPDSAERLYVSRNHIGNFFDCVQSRKPTICEPKVGHRSASMCHIANVAIRLGRKVRWDPVAERFVDDPEATNLASRPMRAPYDYSFVGA